MAVAMIVEVGRRERFVLGSVEIVDHLDALVLVEDFDS